MRAALVLRELDGLEYDEIGITLHIPVGTVRSRINAARAKFKKLWEEETKDLEGDYDVRY
jgi:RNA polymerase sigma-70 factor (ECF subfamily)